MRIDEIKKRPAPKVLLQKQVTLKDGQPITITVETHSDITGAIHASAYTLHGQEFIGSVSFGENDNIGNAGEWSAMSSHVNVPWRRRGVNTALYDAVESLGYKVVPEPRYHKISPDAQAFWKARQKRKMREATAKQAILVVVHPGSACGSAEMNLGRYDGAAARNFLADDIARWQGPIVVIDGELSDELPRYSNLDRALKQALARAQAAKMISTRIWGCALQCNPDQSTAIQQFVKKTNIDSNQYYIELTGAWTGKHGCVDDVWKTLRKLGFMVTVRDSALEES